MTRRTNGTRTLALEVTSRCPASCAYCYNVWKGPRPAEPPAQELPAAELLALVQLAVDQGGFGHVQVSGGEPLLRPDLPVLLAGLRRLGVAVSLVTGGGRIGEALTGELVRLRVGPVQPTLLAARREIHDELKGCRSFDATVEEIARLRKAGVPLSVAFVCTRDNHDQLQGMLELCFALGVQTVAFSRLCVSGEAAGRAGLPATPAMVRGCLEVASWASTALAMKVRMAITLPLCAVGGAQRWPHLAFGRCALTGPRPGMTLDAAGNLRACSISPTVLGNLRVEPWETILERAREQYFEPLTELPEQCTSCAWLARCGGGCRESARSARGGRWGGLDPLAESLSPPG